MNIIWYGQTCFRVLSSQGKNHSVNILIDPPEKGSGLRLPKLEADILLSTQNKKISGSGFVISGPGEYDVKGVYIEGIFLSGNKTIYTIGTEGIRVCHLGLLDKTELNSDKMERIGEVDILMVPVGGGMALDAKGAVKIISQIEPKIIIPMYYKIPKVKEKLDSVDKFLKELGIKSLEPLQKLSIKKKDISPDEAKIIVLKA